jgi:HAMP domain-containing protein
MSNASVKNNGSAKMARGRSSDGPSPEARRTAAAILEVLAGMRTPAEAAHALSVSVPRYYALEQRAVASLVAGCQPHRRGPVQNPQQRIAELEREVRRLRQQCDRHQALARAAQRTIGLSMPAQSVALSQDKAHRACSSPTGKKRHGRRPTVRALKVVEALRQTPREEPAQASRVAEAVSATASP